MATITHKTTTPKPVQPSPPSPPAQHPRIERRRHGRPTLVTKARLLPMDPRHGRFVVVVANISKGGAALHTIQPLPLGSRWKIDLKAGPLSLDGELEVVSCRRRPGGFVVGVRFDGE